MKKITSKEIRENLSEVLSDINFKKETYTVTRNGKDMVVFIPVKLWEEIQKLKMRNTN